MDKTLSFDSLSVLNSRFVALGLALEGLSAHAIDDGCQVEPEQIEAVELLFRDLKREYREVLNGAG